MVINIKEASRKKKKEEKHPAEPSQKFLTHRIENCSCFKSLSPGCFIMRQKLTNTQACLRTHITLGKSYCLFQCLHEAWDWLGVILLYSHSSAMAIWYDNYNTYTCLWPNFTPFFTGWSPWNQSHCFLISGGR